MFGSELLARHVDLKIVGGVIIHRRTIVYVTIVSGFRLLLKSPVQSGSGFLERIPLKRVLPEGGVF